MKGHILLPLLSCLFLCSCKDSAKDALGQIGAAPPGGTNFLGIARPGAAQLADSFIRAQGYTNATVIEVLTCADYVRYRYATNGVALTDSVFVDNKTGRVGLEWKGY